MVYGHTYCIVYWLLKEPFALANKNQGSIHHRFRQRDPATAFQRVRHHRRRNLTTHQKQSKLLQLCKSRSIFTSQNLDLYTGKCGMYKE